MFILEIENIAKCNEENKKKIHNPIIKYMLYAYAYVCIHMCVYIYIYRMKITQHSHFSDCHLVYSEKMTNLFVCYILIANSKKEISRYIR